MRRDSNNLPTTGQPGHDRGQSPAVSGTDTAAIRLGRISYVNMAPVF
jgi:hypothetical protein